MTTGDMPYHHLTDALGSVVAPADETGTSTRRNVEPGCSAKATFTC
jgi:hypothetical protein